DAIHALVVAKILNNLQGLPTHLLAEFGVCGKPIDGFLETRRVPARIDEAILPLPEDIVRPPDSGAIACKYRQPTSHSLVGDQRLWIVIGRQNENVAGGI